MSEIIKSDLPASLADGTYFVSGIDTDAGKTVCTGWLARELMKAGRRVATMKFVQTGCSDAKSPDIALHRRIMGVELPEDARRITAPECFTYPASPDLAARMDGRSIDFERIEHCVALLEQAYNVVLIEGAGGLMVPLTEKLTTIDYVKQCQWPMLFATSGKLGSINHTLLSWEALANREITLSAVIYNCHNAMPDALIDADTRVYLHRVAHQAFPEALWLECPILSREEIG